MKLKEMLAAKKKELAELAPALKSENVATETLEKAQALVAEIAELEGKLAKANEAAGILAQIGTEEEGNTETKKSAIQELAEKARTMTDKKAGASIHLKAATDVVTSVQIADVDRSIAPQPRRNPIADYFTVATISGTAITYFLQGAYEGTPAATAEGAKKPQNSTSFEPVTLALTKIAAYIKETDEILYDEPFLASEVQNSLVFQLGKVEDAAIINAIQGTTGIGAETYDGTTVTFADGILKAIQKVKSDSAYDASIVILNPADVFALLTSKDANKQYYGGGYFAGAYGNGGFQLPGSIWGVQIYASSEITQGQALVAAREAVKIWKKGGLDIRLYEQNEDDAIYNRVTLLAEQRLACAVVDLKGVVLLAEDEGE